ncbi:MAG: S9 family peptidase [Pyrinomonadaceae bacterium]|nr:S9 family peptidase [Pyrinomonadaceae bacterium]
MNKIILIVLVITFATATFANSGTSGLPVLIDRELFFGDPEISGAQISPNGKFVTFVKPFNGTRNIWVKGINDDFSEAKLLTAEPKRPIPGYFWSRDSRFVLFVKDNDGDENFNVYAVDPASAESAESAPAAKNITAGKKIRALIQRVPRSKPGVIIVGLNDRDPAWHDFYEIDIATGNKKLIMENKDRLQGIVFDNKDRMRLSVKSLQSGETQILSIDGEKPEVVYSCGVFETCAPIRFHKNNKQFYMRTNKGDRDLTQLVLFDPSTKKETFVEEDPNKRVDLGGVIFSEVSQKLIATTYQDDKTKINWKDKAFERDYKWLESRLPGKEIGLGSSTTNEKIWIVSASSDTEPGETYIFNRARKQLQLQYRIRKNLPRKALAKMVPIRYKSSDGLEVPGYLTLPRGVEAKNLPVVVFPHGGPWGRDSWGFDTFAQFLANRGYAVLQPNFRASTGYGKKFLNAGNGEWGDLMQDDITWGVKYLVDEGIADPKRVGIMGGSYGGYATLAGVTYTPDTYAAAVAIVAPSNLITLLESIPPYWEAIRTMFYKRMGDPNTEEGRKQLMRQSPLTHADKITTPLMVVQGANDPRVNKRESDQIVVALRDRNYPVEYLVAPDEGHGFARPVNNMAMVASAEKFLAIHLGGRYQSSMPANVSKRLAEITVDPKDVKIEMVASGPGLTGVWKVEAFAGGQQVPMTFEMKQDGDAVTGTVSTPLGNGTITDGKLDGDKITAKLAVNIQGQDMVLDMTGKVDGDKITGTIEGPGIPEVSFEGKKSN